MLAGDGAVAIWNGIAEAGRAEFYAWHLHEHMPERVGIPGFVRGRQASADLNTDVQNFCNGESTAFEMLSQSDAVDKLRRDEAG